ncbi:cuticle protein 2-like [Athalia rosae]|uniref:cuticle protein 2-like n=1 Tax=Athalia rosae TaxID=37344 RepID=UPI002033532E|nr:cuticle protein 2-like [Athalia rosae]
MKFFLAFSALVAVALAKPGFLNGLNGHVAVPAPLGHVHVLPGAPIGVDGRVVDTPEVAHAKAEHAAAHINEKVTLANEAVNSADHVVVHAAAAAAATGHAYHRYFY